MLLLSDVEALERGHEPEAAAERLRRLGRSFRSPWVRREAPIELPDTPAAVAVSRLGGRSAAVVVTAKARVGIVDLAETLAAPATWLVMDEFDPTTDELRNVLLVARTFSAEMDVFVTVRRWPRSSRPPSQLVWRARAWRAGDGSAVLAPSTEGDAGSEGTWRPTDRAADAEGALPAWAFDARVHSGDPETLVRSGVQPEVPHLIAAAPGVIAVAREDGRLSVFSSGVPVCGNMPMAAVGLTVLSPKAGDVADDSKPRLVVVTETGAMFGPCPAGELGAASPFDLGASPSAIADISGGEAVDVLVASQDHRLTRWRWLGPTRLRGLWTAKVQEFSGRLGSPEEWRRWLGEAEHADAVRETQLLLWLHAAWATPTDATLTDALCAAVAEHGRSRRGANLGHELANLAGEVQDAARRALILRVYEAGGLSLREQVDRGRPTGVNDALARRVTRNYWDVADDGDRSTAARAVANLATRPYVHEATWTGQAEWLGALNLEDGVAIVVARRDGLHWLRAPAAGQPIPESRREEESPMTPLLAVEPGREDGLPSPYRWARSLHTGEQRRGIVFGGVQGACVLVWASLGGPRAEPMDGGGLTCLGAMCLAPAEASRLSLGLLWGEGPRTYLDPVEVLLGVDGATVRPGTRLPVPVPAVRADCAILANGKRVLAVTSRTRRVTLLDLGAELREIGALELDSPAMDLRFLPASPGQDPALVVATQAGLAWCLDITRRVPRWHHDTQGMITSIDVSGTGDAVRILLSTAPERLTLLDGAGRRVWRHRIGWRPGDVTLAPERDGTVARIAVLDDAGRLSVYRRVEQDVWRSRAAAIVDITNDRLRAARALATDDLASALDIRQPEARRAILARVAASGRSAMLRSAIRGMDAADIAAVARELPSACPIEEWERYWTRGLDLVEGVDAVDAAAVADMVSELFRHLQRRTTAFAYTCDRIAELGNRSTWKWKGHDATAMHAAHAWLTALQAERDASADTLLGALHRLPPACARHLPRFLPDLELGAVVTSLAVAALERSLPRLPEPAAAGAGSTIVPLLVLALGLAEHPIWPDAASLLRDGAALTPAPSPLVRALREPAVRAPGGDLPDPTWRFDRESRWLAEALGRRHGYQNEANDGDTGWDPLAVLLVSRVEDGFRRAALARLTELVARARPRLVGRVLRWVGDTALVAFELEHEGQLGLDAVTIRVTGTDEDARPERVWDWTGARLAPGDPPLGGRVVVPASGGGVVIRVRTWAAGATEPRDTTDWRIEAPPPAEDETSGNLLLDVPGTWEALRAAVQAVTGGVTVLVLDGPLQPGRVVSRLLDIPDTDVVDLDAPFSPARKGPAELSAAALLRTLAGRDPRDETEQFDSGHPPRSGSGRVLLHPAAEVTRRLLTRPELRGEWEILRVMLAAHAERRAEPAVVLVLPAELATRKLLELPESAGFLHPAIVDGGRWEDLAAGVARRARVDPPAARRLISDAAGDLRVLEDRLARRHADRVGWLRADLEGASAQEIAVLVGLSGARTRLEIGRVRAGMVAAETVVTMPKVQGRASKVLQREGEAVERPTRLANVQGELAVRGIRDDDLGDLPEPEVRLLHLAGYDAELRKRLVRRGLLVREQGLYTLRPDLAAHLSGLRREGRSLEECVAELGDADTWWRAVRLDALVHADADAIGGLRGTVSTGIVELYRNMGRLWRRTIYLCRNVGRLWREPTVAPAVAHALTVALTGRPPSQITPHRPPASGTSGGAQRQVATVHADGPIPQITLHFAARGDALPPGTGIEVIVGPAADDPLLARGYARIGDAEVRELLRAPNPSGAFWTLIRGQLDLTRASPFSTNSALPPNSPMFVGRRGIRAFVKQHLATRSTLILGARRLGKTSLLNQLFHDATTRIDVDATYVDAQGRDTPELLLPALNGALATRRLSAAATTDDAIERLVQHAADAGRVAVLFLNEIDGLLAVSPTVLQRLRGLHESGRLRSVFVGYANARWALDRVESPLYHFTQAATGSAFHLGQLEEAEARELIGWLGRPPLGFQWRDTKHQERAEALLLEHSYCVPWVLQELCQGLVADLTRARRSLIEFDDVRAHLASRGPLLDHLEAIDLAEAMGRGGAAEAAARTGGRLILLLLAWATYFAAGRPTLAEILARPPGAAPFRDEEAVGLCTAGLAALPLLDEERVIVERWLGAVPWPKFLQALSLSLILAPSSLSGAAGWCFLGNIYPGELRRAELRGRSVEDRMLNQAQQLLTILRRSA